jgi:hypothetical protein
MPPCNQHGCIIHHSSQQRGHTGRVMSPQARLPNEAACLIKHSPTLTHFQLNAGFGSIATCDAVAMLWDAVLYLEVDKRC